MKKCLVGCVVLAISLFLSTKTNAQSNPIKIGTFDEQSVLGLMPGIQKVDTALQKYVNDSLKPEYDYELSELMRMDSTFKKDSASMQPSTRGIVQKEINQHKYKIGQMNTVELTFVKNNEIVLIFSPFQWTMLQYTSLCHWLKPSLYV